MRKGNHEHRHTVEWDVRHAWRLLTDHFRASVLTGGTPPTKLDAQWMLRDQEQDQRNKERAEEFAARARWVER